MRTKQITIGHEACPFCGDPRDTILEIIELKSGKTKKATLYKPKCKNYPCEAPSVITHILPDAVELILSRKISRHIPS